MTAVVFDIETGPLPDDQLPPFDRDSVALGNVKDKAKVDAKIAEAEAKWRRELALSPLTGQVLCIAYWQEGYETLVAGSDVAGEEAVLRHFWAYYEQQMRMVGHCICDFDLPFIIRRSWLHGIPVPESVLEKGRYWSPLFVDLKAVWTCGRYGESVSLNSLCQFFGLSGKNGDGADFARLWYGTPEQRQQALAYVTNDVEQAAAVARRMGVI